MDPDLDLDPEDAVSSFLRNKLSELRTCNENLETSLVIRENVLLSLQENSPESNDRQLSWEGAWYKICNNKLIVGIGVRNKSTSLLSHMEAILSFKTIQSSSYTSQLIGTKNIQSLDWKLSPSEKADIIFILPIHLPLQEISQNAEMSLKFMLNENQVTVTYLPDIQISPSEMITASVDLPEVIRGIREHFLSWILSLDKYELVVSTDFSPSSDNNFELCQYQTDSKKQFFLFNKPGVLSGSVLELCPKDKAGNACFYNVYYRDDEQMLFLLHYLHSTNPDVAFLPRKFYAKQLDMFDSVELISVSIKKEIEHLEQQSTNMTELRLQHVPFEHATDIAIANFNENLS